MAKLALVFLAIAVVAGILGFVVNVAGAIAKVLFFIFLVGAALSFLGKSLADRRRGGGA
jgi:uncharacterized membrane protein YtjA (UPF0391 family)